jgi:hypothetical protein
MARPTRRHIQLGGVRFLIVPSVDWLMLEATQYELAYGQEYGMNFKAIPVVAIDAGAQLLHDGSGTCVGNP